MNNKVKKMKDLSCVIASDGRKALINTVKSLLKGSIVPSEIIICIPNWYKLTDKIFYLNNNIKIIQSRKGQVIQRLNGFRKTKRNIVLQIDDDLRISRRCVQILYKTLKSKGKGNVIGPNLINNNKDIFKFKIWKNYKCGDITNFGEGIPMKNFCFKKNLIQTRWIPGGFVIQFKKDIIMKNFFPFNGKAYNEDLINSFLRQKKKINHYVCKSAKCYLVNHSDVIEFKNIINYLKSRIYFLKISKRLNFKFYIFILILIPKLVIKRILNFIKII